jgi:hypothetical protein
MLTALNAADPREVIVIALTEVSPDDAARLLEVDASERVASPLDGIIEPAIDRTFGVLVAEDEFSPDGPVPRCSRCGRRHHDGARSASHPNKPSHAPTV